MAAPMIPQIKLITMTKPVLATKKKMKAFVWKRIILDRVDGNG